MKKCLFTFLLLVFFSCTQAEEHLVGQKNKAFSEKTLTVKVGDTVHFRNDDPFFHNVFSLSDAKFFDLGSYDKGKSKSVKFDTEGSVEVECAIHPEMNLKIEVVPEK
jgi:plastocyanin